jgi:hypothetical protein
MRASAPRAGSRSRSLRARAFALALALALVVAHASSIEAIEAKCSACRAVGKSLAKALREDAESADAKVVDMRGRLDSRGRRYGKRISYKVSELRFVELLDGVCESDSSEVGKYQLHEETNRWRIPPNPVKKIRHARGKQMKTEILGYCHRVIEESEEALQAAVLEERLDADSNVEEFLCRNVSKACDDSVDFSEEEPKDNDFYHDEENESKRDEPPKKKAKKAKKAEKAKKAKKAAKQEL